MDSFDCGRICNHLPVESPFRPLAELEQKLQGLGSPVLLPGDMLVLRPTSRYLAGFDERIGDNALADVSQEIVRPKSAFRVLVLKASTAVPFPNARLRRAEPLWSFASSYPSKGRLRQFR